jgi:rubrerythrin
MAVPVTLEQFMAQALAMEREAVERYGEFADVLETHNNRDVAALFRTLAQLEAKHVEHILDQMGWRESEPVPAPAGSWGPGVEAPETVAIDEVHYLMQPWHALQLALAAEQRAESFFGALAQRATSEPVRRAALEMQAEEAQHVELVKAWLAKVPQPDSDWANDPDPPRYID